MNKDFTFLFMKLNFFYDKYQWESWVWGRGVFLLLSWKLADSLFWHWLDRSYTILRVWRLRTMGKCKKTSENKELGKGLVWVGGRRDSRKGQSQQTTLTLLSIFLTPTATGGYRQRASLSSVGPSLLLAVCMRVIWNCEESDVFSSTFGLNTSVSAWWWWQLNVGVAESEAYTVKLQSLLGSLRRNRQWLT